MLCVRWRLGVDFVVMVVRLEGKEVGAVGALNLPSLKSPDPIRPDHVLHDKAACAAAIRPLRSVRIASAFFAAVPNFSRSSARRRSVMRILPMSVPGITIVAPVTSSDALTALLPG